MTPRLFFVRVWLLLAIVAAGWIAALEQDEAGGIHPEAVPALVRWMVEAEVLHIAAHLITFGVVGFALRAKPRQAWNHAIIGAVLMEGLQVLVGAHSSLPALVWGVFFDLCVDALGTWLGLRVRF